MGLCRFGPGSVGAHRRTCKALCATRRFRAAGYGIRFAGLCTSSPTHSRRGRGWWMRLRCLRSRHGPSAIIHFRKVSLENENRARREASRRPGWARHRRSCDSRSRRKRERTASSAGHLPVPERALECPVPQIRSINRKLSLRAERSNLAKQDAEFATDCFVGLRPSRNDMVGDLGCELPVRDTRWSVKPCPATTQPVIASMM
jgi:hypothetical protein